jgi:hypothetical protein
MLDKNVAEQESTPETEGELRKFLLERFLKQYYAPDDAQFFAMSFAKFGDWEPLATYIELGGAISDDIRRFLLGVLRGEKTKPNNRAPSAIAEIKSAFRADFVIQEQRHGRQRERAINEAADTFGVDRRTIQRDLKAWESWLRDAT